VPLLSWIADLLRAEKVPYTCFRHIPAYTAQEEAAVSHIPQRCWAKVVISIADDQPVQAVLPAHHMVDLEQLRLLANATALRLAREEEIAALYSDCEVGAMPPFGAAYGHRVFVDRCLVGEPEMVFNAGTHTEAICMHYGDFAELTKPIVGAFGRSPSHTQTAPAVALRPRRSSRVLTPAPWREVMKSSPPFPGIRVTANGNQLVSYHTETRIADAGVFYPITPSTEGGELYQQAFAEGKLNVFGRNTIAVETEGEHAAQGGAIAHSVCGKPSSITPPARESSTASSSIITPPASAPRWSWRLPRGRSPSTP
jgi:Ala-tRNA(Pro) deacylase